MKEGRSGSHDATSGRYQLIKSLDHMHRNGIFHRDIKPENILLFDDQLKLADFGSPPSLPRGERGRKHLHTNRTDTSTQSML